MQNVSITAYINLDSDHCKHGEDLHHFITKVQKLHNANKNDVLSFSEIATKYKLNPELRHVNVHLESTFEKSYYIISVNGVKRKPVRDNQIWMHELPQELVNLLQTNKRIL